METDREGQSSPLTPNSPQTKNLDDCAKKIQNLWRAHTNKKIYKYYRDIIFFKSKGNPSQLLKAINPSEAFILDSASNVHVRFRLGGEVFPPNIYYKVFLHGPMCDLNSFAPRDYSNINRGGQIKTTKLTYNEYLEGQKKFSNNGWYLRNDNNGWRPISHKMLGKADSVEIFTAKKNKYFHYNKDKREEKNSKKMRLNKLRWLQNMYKCAKQMEEKKTNEEDDVPFISQQQEKNEGNPLRDKRFLELTNDEFDKEVNDLIEWSENLDYENYIRNWYVLSTSNASNFYSQMSQEIEPQEY